MTKVTALLLYTTFSFLICSGQLKQHSLVGHFLTGKEELKKINLSDTSQWTVRQVLNLALKYKNSEPDTTKLLAKIAVEYSEKIKSTDLIIESKILLGDAYFIKAKCVDALSEYDDARILLKENNNLTQMANVLHRIGLVYLAVTDMEEAYKNLLQAKEIFFSKLNDSSFHAVDISLADYYLRDSTTSKRKGNVHFEQIRQTLENALGYYISTNDSVKIAQTLTTIGEYDLIVGDTSRAINMLGAAVVHLQDNAMSPYIFKTYYLLAKSFASASNLDTAISFSQQALYNSTEVYNIFYMAAAAKLRRELLDKVGQYLPAYDNAITWGNCYVQIANMQSQVSYKKKELAKRALEEEEALAEEKRWFYIKIGLAIIGLIFIAAFFLRFKGKFRPSNILAQIMAFIIPAAFIELLALVFHQAIAAMAHHDPLWMLVPLMLGAYIFEKSHHWIHHKYFEIEEHSPHLKDEALSEPKKDEGGAAINAEKENQKETNINACQTAAIEYVEGNTYITKNKYKEITGCSKKIAQQELTELVAIGIFKPKSLKGGAIAYYLAKEI